MENELQQLEVFVRTTKEKFADDANVVSTMDLFARVAEINIRENGKTYQDMLVVMSKVLHKELGKRYVEKKLRAYRLVG